MEKPGYILYNQKREVKAVIKLIASDLDGTLLTDSKELSQTTVQILDMAVKKGNICDTGYREILQGNT